MRLYPKRLRDKQSLEREKKILLKEKKELDKEDFLSLEGILNKTGMGGEGGEGGSILDLLSGAGIPLKMLVNIAQGIFTKKEKEPRKEKSKERTAERSGKSVLGVVAREFIGGYLKWKAIELSYKGIRLIIKARREKKEDR